MTRRSRTSTVVAIGSALVVAMALPEVSASEVTHPKVVSEDPANRTPRVVPFGAELRPYVNGIGQLGGTMYAGGSFLQVFDDQNDVTLDVQNFVMFDSDTYAVKTDIPDFDGEVWAVEPYAEDGSVFVGGEFGDVDGVTNSDRLVKLNADGSVDASFDAPLTNGRVLDLHMYEGPAGDMLFVGGSAGQKLMALDPQTGANTGYIDLGIADEIVLNGTTAMGDVSVNNFAISPDQTKLVAVGNFRTVAGQSRHRAFMADLPALSPTAGGEASLSEWYYAPFKEFCRSTNPRRLAYLSDVDFAPDSSYFVVVATGFTSKDGDAGKTVCDAAARFETPPVGDMHPYRPTWINYTGGDTIWSVVVTGAAVYVQGHFQYLDDDGVGSGNPPGPEAVKRLGIGAINPNKPSVDPNGGKALPWAPPKPARQGGKQLLATPDGLWVVSDSKRFNGEPRYGIAFAPLV